MFSFFFPLSLSSSALSHRCSSEMESSRLWRRSRVGAHRRRQPHVGVAGNLRPWSVLGRSYSAADAWRSQLSAIPSSRLQLLAIRPIPAGRLQLPAITATKPKP
uniref:Secreted protein n=1 Tax=Oryza meridionalis TaxID=40149 RepID=A0A0E0DB46_9ORYZ